VSTTVIQTPIPFAYELRSSSWHDPRGNFSNIFRSVEPSFYSVWGSRSIRQINVSTSNRVGTIRGLHLQIKPFEEAKLVRCLRGRVWDVCVDLRPSSPTYLKWHAVELYPEANNSFFIPEGCAHGWQALEADSELLYLHSQDWKPDCETGIRYDDPSLSLPWPAPPCNVSERDLKLPFLVF
jgi:dTDP-4-dehydrorhamnose 3,5-epimerase